jgi:tRNA A58 N-methylase Trm61
LFDRRDDWPDWEKPLCEGIHTLVDDGDQVLIIGAGQGVSTVHTAQAAGSDGNVIAYEAVGELALRIADTVERNITPAEVEIENRAVGGVSDWSADTYGSSDNEAIPPAELPEADVVVLDCEGAEQRIIPEIADRVDRIVVETHGFLGSSTEDMRTVLEDAEYTVTVQGAEDANRDVYILSAISQPCQREDRGLVRNDP